MVKKLLVVLSLAFLAGNAAAIDIGVADFYARLDAVATHLGLKPSLPEAGLAGLWPGEVEKLADLPPVIATVADPDRLNGILGEGSAFSKGDFASLSPFQEAEAEGYSAMFFGKEYDKSGPKLMSTMAVADFYGAVEKAGLRMSRHSERFALREHVLLSATMADPATFAEAFEGPGESVKGQFVVLQPGAKGTQAWLGPGEPAKAPSGWFAVSGGKVSQVR